MRTVTIVNLTGHPLVLGTDGNNVTYPSQGRVRLDTRYELAENVQLLDANGEPTEVTIPVLCLNNGATTPIPAPRDNVIYVVSGLVAGRVKRADVVSPARLHRVKEKVQYARAVLRYTKEVI